MKKRIFISFIALLFGILSFGQTINDRSVPFHVADTTTLFNASLIEGTLVFDEATNRLWRLDALGSGGLSLSTVAKTLITQAGGLGDPPLTDVLTAGNTTADGQTINSLNGDVQLNLRDGGDNIFDLTNDNGGFLKAWFYGDNTTTQYGFGNDYFSVASASGIEVSGGLGASNYTSISNAKLSVVGVASLGIDLNTFKIFDNTLLRTIGGGVFNSGISMNNTGVTTFNAGVKNSTSISYSGTVKTDSTLYINQLAFSDIGLGEMLIAYTPDASDFTATFKPESGTIAYLTDIPAVPNTIYSADDALSADRTISMTDKDLIFTRTTGNVGIGGTPLANYLLDIQMPTGSEMPLSFYEPMKTTGTNYSVDFFADDVNDVRTLGSSIIARLAANSTAGNVDMDLVINNSLKVQANDRVLITDDATSPAAVAQLEVRGVLGVTTNTALLVKGNNNTSSSIPLLLRNSDNSNLFLIDGTAKVFHNDANLVTGDFKMDGTANDAWYFDAGENAVVMGGTNPDNSSIFELRSTTKGFKPPDMTNTERDAIVSPISGLILYDNTNEDMNYRNGSSWRRILNAGASTLHKGGVLFADETGSSVDNDSANFFWDDTNKFLGLRQDSPQSILHISDSITPSFQITNNSTGHTINDGFRFTLDETGNVSFTPEPGKGISVMLKGAAPVFSIDKDSANAVFQIRRTGSTPRSWRLVNNGTLFSVVDDTGGSSPFCMENGVATNTLYLESGDEVGIGTANPTEKLDVQGNINTTGVYKVSGSSGLTNTYTFGGGASGEVATMTFTGGILTGVTTVP